jgi:hypothetical protein
MRKGNKKDIEEAGQGLILETLLEVGSDSATEIGKESVTNAIGEILVDTAGSILPGLNGAIQGYKRLRFERNMVAVAEELQIRIEEIRTNLENKTEAQKTKIDELFTYVLDYVIDEQQEEKIQLMVNGFVNITQHDQVTDDFVLTYYDVLKELRMVDISVLRLMNQWRVYIDQQEKETYLDVMNRHGISYEQYEAVRRNLLRLGLLNTRTDLNVTADLVELSNKIKELNVFLGKLTDPKFKGKLPRLKEAKLKSKESLEMSRFGRDFANFFMEKAGEVE